MMQPIPHPRRGKVLAAMLAVQALFFPAFPAGAQLAPPQPRPQGMESEEDRRILNEEQARFAQQQLAQNAASQAEYERRLAEVEAARARIAAEDAAARAAYEEEKARIEAEYAAALAKWEADVAACRAGDVGRCAGN